MWKHLYISHHWLSETQFHFLMVTKPAIFSATYSLIATAVDTKWRQMFYFLIRAVMTCTQSLYPLKAKECRVNAKMTDTAAKSCIKRPERFLSSTDDIISKAKAQGLALRSTTRMCRQACGSLRFLCSGAEPEWLLCSGASQCCVLDWVAATIRMQQPLGSDRNQSWDLPGSHWAHDWGLEADPGYKLVE